LNFEFFRIGAGQHDSAGLVQHATLVGGHHVLDIDESILAAMSLERLKSLLNQVADVFAFLLALRKTI